MDILYKSTRGNEKRLTASQAIIQGLSEDGGLFVPESVPSLDIDFDKLAQMSYQECAFFVMKKFFTDFTDEELKNCIDRAYDSKFDTKEIAPVVKTGDCYYLELFHGATIAFKDMALSILPHLLTTAMAKNNLDKKVVILTATSGDTGKAALAGFADVPGTNIIVFYPKGGVSRIQELQMVTQKGDNTKVVGVRGNFDDCQSNVKNIFNNADIKEMLGKRGYCFSSANSINIGRLIPQVAYYVYAYAKLMKDYGLCAGKKVNFVVPTGNFGNILACYIAKQMGLPVDKMICASNDNKVLFDFFKTGVYDRRREFILTSSPSMDILISSNLERLIYFISGENAEVTAQRMKDLSEKGVYEITDSEKAKLSDFVPAYASEADVKDTISKVFSKDHYVIDPHTAVAAFGAMQFMKDSTNPVVVVSTASPYKFTPAVMNAIDGKRDEEDVFALIHRLSNLSGVSIPNAVREIENADILHDCVADIADMESVVCDYLK